MRSGNVSAILVLPLCMACAAYADTSADAQKLKDEALAIFKANAARQATPAQYAECIFKLEQAQALLEKAGDTSSSLSQEVSATLFWARRFSDVNVIAALDKLHGGKSAPLAPPPKKAEPAKPASADEPIEPPQVLAAAKKVFTAAQAYAAAHKNDDYALALCWFQVAAEHPGTDYALKALALAREAQARFAGKDAKAGEGSLPDTPEMKLVGEADALAAAGNYEKAFPLYLSSLKLKETLVAHRKLGHAYFRRAQQLKDDFLPKFEAVEEEYHKAWKNAFKEVRYLGYGVHKKFIPDYPPLLEAKRKGAELLKEANVSIAYYNKAQSEFSGVLRMAPGNKDLDAAGHQALCLSVNGETNTRARAKMLLPAFLSDYKPANDVERSLYEFCKAELERLRSGG